MGRQCQRRPLTLSFVGFYVMTIFSYTNLYKAYLDCRKNKRSTDNALKFEYHLEENLMNLLTELKNGTYAPGRSICFVVKYPQPREIFAADFRDRIVHHLMVREILDESDKCFFFNSFACRKGKGTHQAVKTLRRYLRACSRGGKDKVHYLQLDIKNFFVSIKHDILFYIFNDFILKAERTEEWKKEILWLGSTITFHEPAKNCEIRGDRRLFDLIPRRKSLFYAPKGSGLPIGNYSSQFFANMYLNELDYFVKQKLEMKYYVRYVDDFVLLHNDESKLLALEAVINNFLGNRLAIKLNLDKTKLKETNHGIDFLGYFIKPDYMLIRRRVVSNCKNKIYEKVKIQP